MIDSPEPVAQEGGPLPLDHPFVEAVSNLDLEGVAEMLIADPRLVDADLHGRAWIGGPKRTAAGWERAPEQTSRPVHLAAYGHAGLLRLLIAHGADVDAPGYEGNHGWAPPLVLACWEGTVETVRLLLEAGADPNLPSRPGGSALHAAINHYDAEKIELLLRHGARHDLYSAAAVGDLEEVERQLAAGDGLLDRRDDLRGRTPLEWAVFNRRQKVARHLLEAGAEASPQVLVGLGKLDEVRQLAEADPGFVNRPLAPEREPPLMHALRSRDLEMVTLLLRLGADPDSGGWEPGADAESHGRDGLPLSSWRGQSPLARAGDPAFAEILIDAGADVNGEFIPGRSFLFHYLRHGRFDVARLLLSRGADPDRLGKSRGGTTTLQSLVAPDGVEARDLARRGEYIPAMELLLDHGAGVNTLSAEGLTALDYAVETDSAPVTDFLRQRGGRRARDLDTQEGEPWTTS